MFENFKSNENLVIVKKWSSLLARLNIASIAISVVLTIIGISFFQKQEMVFIPRTLYEQFGFVAFILVGILRFAWIVILFKLPWIVSKVPGHSFETASKYISLSLLAAALFVNGFDALHDALNVAFNMNFYPVSIENTAIVNLVLLVIIPTYFIVKDRR